jgi:hypothetical protein
MREKLTRRRRQVDGGRRPTDEDLIPTGQSPARWLLANEAGWGVPHGLVGMAAALVAGYAMAGLGRWATARLSSRGRSQAAARRPRTPRAR